MRLNSFSRGKSNVKDHESLKHASDTTWESCVYLGYDDVYYYAASKRAWYRSTMQCYYKWTAQPYAIEAPPHIIAAWCIARMEGRI